MKFLITGFLCVFMFLCGKSQDSTTTLSRFEKFVSQPGNVVKTEKIEAGQYGANKVVKYIATDIVTKEQSYAVRIDNYSSFSFPEGLIDRQAIYIDSADLDSFIAIAEGFLKTAEGKPLSYDTRFSYLMPTDVQLSCYFVKLPDTWGFQIDKVFQKLRTRIPGTSITMNKKRMQQLIALLKQAKLEL